LLEGAVGPQTHRFHELFLVERFLRPVNAQDQSALDEGVADPRTPSQ
jgi:hypothetical protein